MVTKTKATYTLYTTPTRTEYYLIERDAELPAGEAVICTLDRRERWVDKGALAAYRVSRWKARQYIAEQARAILQTAEEQHNLPKIGPTVLSYLCNPWRTGRLLRQGRAAFEDILNGVTSTDPAHHEAARARIHAIRMALAKHNITLNESIEQLPDRLRQKYQDEGRLEELRDSASVLKKASHDTE